MYRVIDSIKSGAYGTVFKVKTADDQIKALKCSVKEDHIDGISNIREAAILYNYKHPHIVDVEQYHMADMSTVLDENGCTQLKKIVAEKYSADKLCLDDIYMLMEYADNDGEHVINEGIDRDMDKLLLHTLLAVEYIHNSGIAHLDIKANNVLYFKDQDKYKLCDMGLCMHINKLNITPPNICIEAFRSPELLIRLVGQNHGELSTDYCIDLKAVDIWSIGMMWVDYLYEYKDIFMSNTFDLMSAEAKDMIRLYNMLLLEHSAEDLAELRKIGTVALKYYEEYFVDKTTEYTVNSDYGQMPELLRKMLHINPKKRWTATQCLDSDYFNEYRDYISEVRSEYSKVDDIQVFYKSKYNIMLDSTDNETFTADRLFNEYMYHKYDMNINSPEDKTKYAYHNDDLVIVRYVCWYIMHKYYGVMLQTEQFPLELCKELFTDKYKTLTDEQLLSTAMNIEKEILEYYNMRVYRNNPIDHVADQSTDNLSYLTYYISRTKPGIYQLSDYILKFNNLTVEEKRQYLN